MGGGGAFQDVKTRMPTCPCAHQVGLWLALEDATETNGCMCVLPGSHTSGLARRMLRGADDKVCNVCSGGGSFLPLSGLGLRHGVQAAGTRLHA